MASGMELREPPSAALVVRDRTPWFDAELAAERFGRAARVLAVLAAFAIPISTSGTDIALAAAVFCWLFSGKVGRNWAVVRANRVGHASALLFAWLIVGTCYSTAGLTEAIDGLCKYRHLLYVPGLLAIFDDRRLRSLGLNAYLAAMLITLAGSYAMWFGLVEETKWGTPENCAVFKNHITQNVMMAFTAFVMAHAALNEPHGRWWRLAVAAAAVFNVLFMVYGRTGYVIVAALVLLLSWKQLGVRGSIVGLLVIAALGGTAYATSSAFRGRIDRALAEGRGYLAGNEVANDNSIGLRLQFLENGLELAAQRPVFGYGTGAFHAVYTELADRKGIPPTHNPHNEYVMLLVQTGLVGVLLLLGLFVVQWVWSLQLPPGRRTLAQAVVLTIAVGCLVNSLLLDTTEGNFFAYFTGLFFAGLRPTETDG